MKKKLLILSSAQFGYLTDTLKYCQYGVFEFDITYIGWDYNNPVINMPGVTIRHVSRKGNILIRNFRLLRAFAKEAKKKYDFIFVCYVRGISIVRLLNLKKKIILDIRTLSVSRSASDRRLFNFFLKLESRFFKNLSIISEGVANEMGVKKYFLLPLGADIIMSDKPKPRTLSLLYVGTLQNRDIIKCVQGFHFYCKASGDTAATFTIIGGSSDNEPNEIKRYIKEHLLEGQINFVGTVPHNQLGSYFEKANVGVSFIPLTPYFNFQPATKTYEYLLAGLHIIATNTYENKKVLSANKDAFLINDTQEEFSNAIFKLAEKESISKVTYTAESVERFSWKYIVQKTFYEILRKAL